MIRIVKPGPPATLAARAEAATRRVCDTVARGDVSPTFQQDIYGDASVRRALIGCQHGKCCFCESKIGVEGDVEHFRPKAAYRQSREDALTRPGYYWLAYDWNNLLLCCTHCNQREKANLFPLAADGVRATGPSDDLAAEKPLFVHPVSDDPEAHIGFDRHDPIWFTDRGEATVRALGLDRVDRGLAERRLDRWRSVWRLLQVAASLRTTHPQAPELGEVDALLTEWQFPTAEFSAMTRAAVRAWEQRSPA